MSSDTITPRTIPTCPPTHTDHKHQSTEVSASQRPDLEDFFREIKALIKL